MKSSKTSSKKSLDVKSSEPGVQSSEKKSKSLLRTTNFEPQIASVAQTMEELLALSGYDLKVYKKGDSVEGTLASVTGKEILIDVGGKTEGVVGEKEYDQIRGFVSELKVGDKVTGIVISAENDRGQLVLSLRKAGADFRWQKMEKLLKNGETISVKGVEINKGGLIVEIEGLRGFVPTSQLSMENQSQVQKLINKTFPVIVIEVNKDSNRLIFSERQLTAASDLVKKLESVNGKVKVGEKYKGKVSAVMPYGIFVNLDNGADGLVHISEISWAKVENLETLFKVGEDMEVLVLGISQTDGKLNLSIKQLQPDPWLKIADRYVADKQISGRITRVTQYGVFIELEEGIEGLMRNSKMQSGVEYKVGDEVSCLIEAVDLPAHKIALVPVLTEKPVLYK